MPAYQCPSCDERQTATENNPDTGAHRCPSCREDLAPRHRQVFRWFGVET